MARKITMKEAVAISKEVMAKAERDRDAATEAEAKRNACLDCEDYQTEITCLKAEVATARRTAEGWKAEIIAANKDVDWLETEVERLKTDMDTDKWAMSQQRDRAESGMQKYVAEALKLRARDADLIVKCVNRVTSGKSIYFLNGGGGITEAWYELVTRESELGELMSVTASTFECYSTPEAAREAANG